MLAIIGLISMVVLTSQSNFNRTITLANTAYDIALTLRSAQTYGLGSRATSAGIPNVPYGVHFAGNNSFVFFADTLPTGSTGTPNCRNSETGKPDCQPGNYAFTSGSDVVVQTYTIGNSITIQDFCAYSSGAWQCRSNGLASLDIVFARPDPDPFISKNGAWVEAFPVTQACITLAAASAPAGPYRYIKVAQSGEITANGTSCP